MYKNPFEHELEGPGFIEGMISHLPYTFQKPIRDKGLFHRGGWTSYKELTEYVQGCIVALHSTPNAYIQSALPPPARKTSVGARAKVVSSVSTHVMQTEAAPTNMQPSNTYRPTNTGMQSCYQCLSPCLMCSSLEHHIMGCPEYFKLNRSVCIELLQLSGR